MFGSALVASVYSVPFYFSTNAAKQKTVLNFPVRSSSVGAFSSVIRCGAKYYIFGMAYVTLSSGLSLVLLITLRGALSFLLPFL